MAAQPPDDVDLYGILAAYEEVDPTGGAAHLQRFLAPGGGFVMPSADAVIAAGAARSDGAGSRYARSGDLCGECRSPLEVVDLAYECSGCRLVYEAADIGEVLPVSCPSDPGAAANRGRLRIVGDNAGWYQRDLDRTKPAEAAESQKKTIYNELLRMNVDFQQRKWNPFTLDVLQDVAEQYSVVQETGVRRSMMKKVILAACLYYACLHRGFARSKEEVSEFVGLPTHGIARGDDYLRSLDEDRGLSELDLNCSTAEAHIYTTFARLERSDDYARFKDAVAEIVQTAEDNHIADKSVTRSKVVAASYEVLRRAKVPVSFNDVATKCGIRRHTIANALKSFEEYHSYFEEIYERHGLNSGLAQTS